VRVSFGDAAGIAYGLGPATLDDGSLPIKAPFLGAASMKPLRDFPSYNEFPAGGSCARRRSPESVTDVWFASGPGISGTAMTRRVPSLIAASVLALGAIVGGGSGSAAAATSRGFACVPPQPPSLPPASDFVSSVDNPYFPLQPGTTFLYAGQEDGQPESDKVTVTHRKKTILGIRATVVTDLVVMGGAPSEATTDWYAQDRRGNVWYLGEDVFDYVDGQWVPAEDSWEAGVDGARPGFIMEAHSKTGDTYAQEHFPGHAMDVARVADTNATVSVPYGTFHHALKTLECTSLEPGVLDVKFYARGVGEVREATVRGGSANLELVSVRKA